MISQISIHYKMDMSLVKPLQEYMSFSCKTRNRIINDALRYYLNHKKLLY